ncbi:MAG: hypothetical protein WCS20_10600 [Alphaproteobacteria bacterium]
MVIAVLLAVIGLAALNVSPIQYLAFIGVQIVMVTGVIDSDEALLVLDGRLIALPFGNLAVGAEWDLCRNIRVRSRS